jgi:hypothetical protein
MSYRCPLWPTTGSAAKTCFVMATGLTLATGLVTAPAVARAEVREVQTVAAVVAAAQPDDLIVFDIDNTLVTPVQMLGSDTWYYHLMDSLVAGGATHDAATDEADAIWNRVQKDIRVRPVEADEPKWVAALQARGLRVVALTARSVDAADVTRKQLKSVGYQLDAGSTGRPAQVLTAAGGAPIATFRDGVVYVGERGDKGSALVAFLAHQKLTPARVLFVDDKPKHTASVDAALQAQKLPVVAFRYGAADAAVAAFDPAVADLQFRLWQSVMSDEEARAALRCLTAPK